MVAVYSITARDSGAAHRAGAPDRTIRGPEPATPASPRRRHDADEAPHLRSRIFTPFVAQVLAQTGAVSEPADPRAAVAAYTRSAEPRFERLDLVPPV
jgi:hypothetical protein